MRLRNVTIQTAAFLAAFGISAAHAQSTLRVERVVSPDVARAIEARGGRPAGSVMTGTEVEAQRLRSERWHGTKDFLSAPNVNWSRFASRRAGWRAPVPPLHRRGDARPASALGPGLPPPDTIRVAILRIDFLNDRDGGLSTGNGRFDLTGPDMSLPPIDRPPRNRSYFEAHAEALERYYNVQTYGRTVVVADVWPRVENIAYSATDMADFGPWEFSPEIFDRAVHMFRTFLFAADSQSIELGDRIPWDSYDRFVLLHAGSDLQSDVRIDSPRDIPSFTIGVGDTSVVIFPDSTTRPIDRAALIPETTTQDGFYGAINGVLAHESGHLLFGMGDLYDISTGIPTVGFWSLMDSGNLAGARIGLPSGEIFATGLLPPSLDPFHRQFTSDVFIPFEVPYGDTITLGSSQRSPDVYSVTLSSDEHLLIENRYIAPVPAVELDQDEVSRVILGPKVPDRYEYDALLPVRYDANDNPLPSGGILVWQIDQSVIPLEFNFPLDTTLRANPDLGFNSNPFRLGVSIIEADGLDDLGDLSSPFILGAHLDPFFRSNNPTLSDTTRPNLIPHIGTRPHVRLNFLDEPAFDMRVAAFREWQVAGWPILGDFPPNGPELLAIDADGDRNLEICWAGGDSLSPDSLALFAVRSDGTPLGAAAAFARLDRRPRRMMAAIATGSSIGSDQFGPSLFAVSTYADGPDTSTAGGRVWLLDHMGQVQPGWPAALPSIVTTPPVIAGVYPNAVVYVGCADGRVYRIGFAGQTLHVSDPPLAGAISGRLAVAGPFGDELVAAGSSQGEIGIFDGGLAMLPQWPVTTGMAGLEPDFLWVHLDGASPPSGQATTCPGTGPALIAHHADRLWAFCTTGAALPGWGLSMGDTLVASLGAGDPDGDGLPEVLIQSRQSWVGFVNRGGGFSPGWPRRGTGESFLTGSPALALDVDGDGRGEMVAMNASGIVSAFRGDGKTPAGWPLASGVGAMGSPVAADLDRDGIFEIVVPDKLGVLFAYTLPSSAIVASPDDIARASSWRMVGGDPGRTSYLPIGRTTTLVAASAGPLEQGSFKAYPNPARMSAVKFAFRLTEPAAVEFRIFDTSGHLVTTFSRDGVQSDNLVTWDPGTLPAGLYLAQVRFSSASGKHFETVQVGLLR